MNTTERGSAAAVARRAPASLRKMGQAPCFAALDLGTNNCRLLIASATPAGGIRPIESFSRIVRLGDGLTRTGRLDPEAIERALGALRVCAHKIARRGVVGLDAVATQACRVAADRDAFIERVRSETGIALRAIPAEEEAALAVAGCRDLIDPEAEAALVLDVGGGSTELSWVEVGRRGGAPDRTRAWLSMPVGVVTLAERFPEPDPPTSAWFRAMMRHVASALEAFPAGSELDEAFRRGGGHIVGTSGAITGLAALHFGLLRYDRSRVDGAWLSASDCDAAIAGLMAMTPRARAETAFVGPGRADLVLPGAAILQAVNFRWPASRVRVADRGLREGLLLRQFAKAREGEAVAAV